MESKITSKVDLNEKWTKLYLNDLISSDCAYLSDISLENIEKYVTETRKIDITKELWKSLLIDSICILKLNDARENAYKELHKKPHLFDKIQFKRIRKTSSYGIDELSKYLDDFVDFEAVLYGMDNHYRDHINHVIQVWTLGLSLIDNNHFEMNDGYKAHEEVDFHYLFEDNQNDIKENDNDKKKEENNYLKISKSEIWAMWTIIALCHDLGYPIEKSSKINKKTKQIINHFGSIQFTELDYNFSILNTFLVEKFLDITSSKVDPLDKPEHPDKQFRTSIQTKYRDKLSKSLEDYKHGLFSSLLLFKDLTYFLETDYFVGKPLENEDARQFYIRKEILRSIAGHTCPKLYHINLNTLSFLLILCDELQEWNRPNFNSYYNNILNNEPKVKLLEFSLPTIDQVNTLSTIQSIHIEMKYSTNDLERDEEYLVRNKFKMIHYLLRSAKEDYNRKVKFQWDIYLNEKRYKFIFDSEKEIFDQVDITHFSESEEEEFILYK